MYCQLQSISEWTSLCIAMINTIWHFSCGSRSLLSCICRNLRNLSYFLEHLNPVFCFCFLWFLMWKMYSFYLSKYSLLILISIDINTAMLQQKPAQLSLCSFYPNNLVAILSSQGRKNLSSKRSKGSYLWEGALILHYFYLEESRVSSACLKKLTA